MLHNPRRCIVDYRVPEADFDKAVAHYGKLLDREKPDVEKPLLAVFKVFTANIDPLETTYQAELRVTGVKAGSPALQHSPAVYWGSDEVDGDFAQLEHAGELPGTTKEPVQPDPSGMYTTPRLGSLVDVQGYRMGVAINPDYPGRKEWITLLLLLSGAGKLLLLGAAGG
ncbi:hypothetical protein [Hymenobacter yonginensis]|uniref:Uncharacterized protein n=1 Tax=Hymenobacter yonginensis TaxID=748197 RepID=A0ABY7PPN5_9BACT|nr:hypothetical protein [Hymenobacter yonginensis]WBO83955.1 hypothetical protein O9Z63_16440 [Hymenobacter yonginensis]